MKYAEYSYICNLKKSINKHCKHTTNMDKHGSEFYSFASDLFPLLKKELFLGRITISLYIRSHISTNAHKHLWPDRDLSPKRHAVQKTVGQSFPLSDLN